MRHLQPSAMFVSRTSCCLQFFRQVRFRFARSRGRKGQGLFTARLKVLKLARCPVQTADEKESLPCLESRHGRSVIFLQEGDYESV